MNYKKLMPKRSQDSHKGTFGKILNIAGSKNYQGAACLSSLSALKIGAGYVTLACPEEIVNNIASFSPDITFLPLKSSPLKNTEIIAQSLDKFDVISIGSGLGTEKRTILFVEKVLSFLNSTSKPVVIDADGLNAISAARIAKLPPNTIITPHEVEMARLLGVNVKDVSRNRILSAHEASEKFNCVTVLKGPRTIICDEKSHIIINKTGNSALAKAGTGDVLTGIISGLLAQGCTPFDAAVFGVYLHGKSGELASRRLTQYSVLASDLLEFIPQAIKRL